MLSLNSQVPTLYDLPLVLIHTILTEKRKIRSTVEETKKEKLKNDQIYSFFELRDRSTATHFSKYCRNRNTFE